MYKFIKNEATIFPQFSMKTKKNSCIYKKEVDWSVLRQGLTIPVARHVKFRAVMRQSLRRGESLDIKLLIDGQAYDAKLINQNFDAKKYPNRNDLIQIRYEPNSSTAKKIREIFRESFEYLAEFRKNDPLNKHQKRSIPIAEEKKEYLLLYPTPQNDTFLVKYFQAGNQTINAAFVNPVNEESALGKNCSTEERTSNIGQSQKRKFGHVDGYPPGGHFKSREELRDAGLHLDLRKGISGTEAEGADAIVLSGGYIDDLDLGDEIVYTGMGGRDQKTGRQIADQKLKLGNLALAKSRLEGLPVRVIRGSQHKSPYSPKNGYRYDGLFLIDECWQEVGRDGFQIWRYRLIRLPESLNHLDKSVIESSKTTPDRRETKVCRIVRDSKLSKLVKEIYDYSCQICGIQLITPGGSYAEGAHIRPLGKPHNGTDSLDNLLCLCPNHHVLFDNLTFTIEDNFELIGTDGTLKVDPKHKISKENLRYHREHRFKIK